MDFSLILPPSTTPPSGMVNNINNTSMSGIVFLGVYSEGFVNTILFITSGTYVRIFEGYNGTYLFTTPSGVIFSEDFLSWSSKANYAHSITQIDDSKITVLFKNTTNATALAYTQAVPETYAGWNLAATMSGITVADSTGEPDAKVSTGLPILVGNNRSNAFARILRNDIRTEPIGAFVKSDSGIPQTLPSLALITDLEAV